MDRFALLVDAGYLYAAGGKLCCDTRARENLTLDSSTCIDSLVQLAGSSCGLPVLRTYWYDGARDAVPTATQLHIASHAYVKLRLGHLNSQNRQKGVDALIYRDLMTLARERAISAAFLLAGDEDLREGVKTAQDMGVQVTLIGIATRDGSRNVSRTLENEADEVIVLGKSDVSPFISRRQSTDSGSSGPANQLETVRGAATAYAMNWLERATEGEVAALLSGRPQIPRPLDVELLIAAEGAIGGTMRGRDELRHAARGAFWAHVSDSAEILGADEIAVAEFETR